MRRSTATEEHEAPGRQLDADGVAHHVLQDVGLVEHDDVVLGEDDAAAGDVEPVEVGVDDDDVGRRRPSPGQLGEARARPSGSGRHRGTRRCSTLTARHVASDGDQSSSAESPVRVSADPGRRSGDLGLRRRRQPLELELGAVAAGRRQLAQALQADVVAAALEDGPVERFGEGLGQERQVLRGQLVLQRLGRRGDDARCRRTRWRGSGRPASCRCPSRPGRRGGGRTPIAAATASAIRCWPGRRSAPGSSAVTASSVRAVGLGVSRHRPRARRRRRPARSSPGAADRRRSPAARRLRRSRTRARAASSSAASNSGQVRSVKWIAAPALCQSRKFEMRSSPDVRTRTSTGGSSGR